MDSNPRVGPAQDDTLTVSPEMMQRLEEARAGMAQSPNEPTFLSPGDYPPPPSEGINPNGYAQRMKAAPLPVVSRAERARRKAAVNTFEFAIPEWDDEYGEYFATVTKPSILTLIESGTLPQNLRKAVDRLISAGAEGVKQATEDMIEESASESLGTLLTVANYMCVVGFVDPKVVATKDEAENEGCIFYGDIPHAVRMRFWNMIQTEAEEMAEAVKPFPEQTIEPGDSGPDVRADELQGERLPAGRSS